MKKGFFITFEGPDGSGKTTVTNGVYEVLKKEGKDVLLTREPGGIDIAEQIRSVILDPKNTAMDARTEALLYAASRRQHLVEKILPALEAGKIVLCDRFVDSSLAYQGYARGLGIDEVWQINQFAIEGHLPEKTLYLDVPYEVGLARIQAHRASLDRLDQEKADFHKLVQEGYQAVMKQFPERFTVVDATKEPDQVIADCVKEIEAFLCV